MPVGVYENYALQQAFCCFVEREQAKRSNEFHLGSVDAKIQPASIGDQSSLGGFLLTETMVVFSCVSFLELQQEFVPDFLHCRHILYCLSHQETVL